ncbi:MAG: hypothetical protein U0105_21270 [Candidatus Obscuribacterales bacterium]|jgi:hypothetical protein
MGISWGRKKRFRFRGAGTLAGGVIPDKFPAVFAVTFKRDAANRPKAHTVLYFGEGADASADVQAQFKNIRDLWHHKGGNDSDLFVFYLGMPSSTYVDRATVQLQLIAEYDPPLNN